MQKKKNRRKFILLLKVYIYMSFNQIGACIVWFSVAGLCCSRLNGLLFVWTVEIPLCGQRDF